MTTSVLPTTFDEWNARGIALGQAGQFDLASEAFVQALALNPESVDALNNIGLVLISIGKPTEALPHLLKATSIHPGFARANNNLGNVYTSLGKLDDALAAYELAIRSDASYAAALRNKVITLAKLGRHQQQADAARALIVLAPQMPEGKLYLGYALQAMRQYREAYSLFQASAQMLPADASPQTRGMVEVGLGRSAHEIGSSEKAEEHFRMALHHEPDSPWAKLGLAVVWDAIGRVTDARKVYLELLELAIHPLLAPELFGKMLFASMADETLPPEERFALQREYGARFQPANYQTSFSNNREPSRRLRVGFLSPDFNNHSVTAFLYSVLEQFDRTRIELFAYSNTFLIDATTELLRKQFSHWTDCRELDDDALVRSIQDAKIDILIDLALHTADNRITALARKPAPVQATWLGYSGSTGLTTIDFHITDASMNPVGLTDAFHTEKLWRLDGPAVVFQPGYLPVAPRAKDPNQPFVFASTSQLIKLNPRVARVWATILNRAPKAKLLIAGMKSEADCARIRRLFEPLLTNLAQLELHRAVTLEDYFRLHHNMSLLLDTFPYTGGTTTGYALLMGVPVLTLDEPVANPRMPGITLIRSAGLEEFIAPSEEAYIEKAAALYNDPTPLVELRQTLRKRLLESPDNSPALLARRLENAFGEMWRGWCEKQAARDTDGATEAVPASPPSPSDPRSAVSQSDTPQP